jgi:hypothetical protein
MFAANDWKPFQSCSPSEASTYSVSQKSRTTRKTRRGGGKTFKREIIQAQFYNYTMQWPKKRWNWKRKFADFRYPKEESRNLAAKTLRAQPLLLKAPSSIWDTNYQIGIWDTKDGKKKTEKGNP